MIKLLYHEHLIGKRKSFYAIDIIYNNSFYYKARLEKFTLSFWTFLKRFITNCDKQRKFNKFQKSYYKVQQRIITKCDRY